MIMTNILISAIVGLAGAVAYLWKQTSALATASAEWHLERIEKLESTVEQLRQAETKLADALAAMEKENIRLRHQLLLYVSSHDSSPLGQWFKDRSGTVLACNKSYESLFLKPRGYSLGDYVGGTDSDVWPQHIADAFAKTDEYVLKTETVFDGMETITTMSGGEIQIRVIKWPRYVEGIDEPFGVAGMAIAVSKGKRKR